MARYTQTIRNHTYTFGDLKTLLAAATPEWPLRLPISRASQTSSSTLFHLLNH